MSGKYTQGDVVRVTATFSFDVPDAGCFFELTNVGTKEKIVIEIGQVIQGLQILHDPDDTKKAYVDIDTFERIGSWQYYFYSRSSDHRAGAKGNFSVT